MVWLRNEVEIKSVLEHFLRDVGEFRQAEVGHTMEIALGAVQKNHVTMALQTNMSNSLGRLIIIFLIGGTPIRGIEFKYSESIDPSTTADTHRVHAVVVAVHELQISQHPRLSVEGQIVFTQGELLQCDGRRISAGETVLYIGQ